MKYLSFLFVLLIVLPSCSTQQQQVEEPAFEPTHTLELLVEGMEEPAKINTQLNDKGTEHFISVIMPDDERIDSEYIITEEHELKFMITDIKDNSLLTIHYMGFRNQDGDFEGKFTALVDGTLRENMCGDFTLKKN